MHEHQIINGIEIDTLLVPIIQWIWEKGIETVACCQEVPEDVPANFFGPGYSWIRFKSLADYEKFMVTICPNF